MQCTAGWYQGFVFALQILQKGIPIGKTDHIPQAGYPAVINIHFAEFFQDGIHLVPGNSFVMDPDDSYNTEEMNIAISMLGYVANHPWIPFTQFDDPVVAPLGLEPEQGRDDAFRIYPEFFASHG